MKTWIHWIGSGLDSWPLALRRYHNNLQVGEIYSSGSSSFCLGLLLPETGSWDKMHFRSSRYPLTHVPSSWVPRTIPTSLHLLGSLELLLFGYILLRKSWASRMFRKQEAFQQHLEVAPAQCLEGWLHVASHRTPRPGLSRRRIPQWDRDPKGIWKLNVPRHNRGSLTSQEEGKTIISSNWIHNLSYARSLS